MIALSILSVPSRMNKAAKEYKTQKYFPGNSFDVLFMARLVMKGYSCMKVGTKKIGTDRIIKSFS